jgi:hypothetical protein
VNAGPPRLHLAHPRDLSALFRDSFAVYWAHFWIFVVLGAVVVVPVQLIVQGIGQEQLTASYDSSLSVTELIVPTLVSFLVVAPLIAAVCIHALRQIADGGTPRAREALVAGFEAFTPLFFAVALSTIGVAIGLVLIVPGVYLFIRWFFVPQAVVLDGGRGVDALRFSAEVTTGSWWRTLGLIIVVNLATLIPGLLLTAPFAGIAESTDHAVWSLVGSAVTESVTAPFVAIFATLVWFDLRARRTPG